MRLKVTLAYDGSKFHGWQIQPNAYTVQEELHKALKTITNEDIKTHASGRTDTGVHALKQVFHFDTNLDSPNINWIKALNNILPSSIHIREVIEVEDTFHARYDAKEKTYIYKISTADYDVFTCDYIYQYNQKINLEKIDEIIPYFLDKKDYTSYNKTPVTVIEDQVREIKELTYSYENNLLTFKIVGDGFLHNMIRMMIASIMYYQEGKISKDLINQAFMEPSKELIKINYPANGLYLSEVKY